MVSNSVRIWTWIVSAILAVEPLIGAEILFVPVGGTGAHSINGQHIVVSQPQTVTLEIRIAEWDFDRDGDPLLRAYQVQLDASGLTSGEAGELRVGEMIPCANNTDCPAGEVCLAGGRCSRETAAFIDESHPNYVFSGLSVIAAVDTSQPDVRFLAVTFNREDAVADEGSPRYAATMLVDVPADARGTFTVGFRPDGTFLVDSEDRDIEPLSFAPAMLTIIVDCNGNGVPDDEDIASGTSPDCNANGAPDECDIADGASEDCNENGVPDECDLSSGASGDCNDNGIPDECESGDCNDNDVADVCDILLGTSEDCDGNDIPDECEFLDCNGNGIHDPCDILSGTSEDCDGNGVPDECGFVDCNDNGVHDACDILDGASPDVNENGVPDDCEPATVALVPVGAAGPHLIEEQSITVLAGEETVTLDFRVRDWDLNRDGDPRLLGYQVQLDSAGFTSGDGGALSLGPEIPCTSNTDCPSGEICRADAVCSREGSFFIDEEREDYVFAGLETIAAANTGENPVMFSVLFDSDDAVADSGTVPYAGTVVLHLSPDARGTFVIRFVQGDGFSATALVDDDSQPIEPLATLPASVTVTNDCNDNGVDDADDIAGGTSEDCNANGLPDECDVAFNVSTDCNLNGVPDECELTDCNGNGVLDPCDIASGTSVDCDANGVPDECEPFEDCNDNGVRDVCDIASGASADSDGNGVPDECDFPAPQVTAAGGRYLTITPAGGSEPVALRVTSPAFPCLLAFVLADGNRGLLVTTPTFQTGDAWGTLTVADTEVIPATTYEVRAEFAEGMLSLPVTVTTPLWGDVAGSFESGRWTAPDGRVTIDDVLAGIDAMLDRASAPPLARADLGPELPDGTVTIQDVLLAIDAMRGRRYPFTGPCD